MPLAKSQPTSRIGGGEKSGLADLIDGRATDDMEEINPVSKGKKKSKSALHKQLEILQGAPILYPDEVLVS